MAENNLAENDQARLAQQRLELLLAGWMAERRANLAVQENEKTMTGGDRIFGFASQQNRSEGRYEISGWRSALIGQLNAPPRRGFVRRVKGVMVSANHLVMFVQGVKVHSQLLHKLAMTGAGRKAE